jgi:predicted O-methyltransferase YrrM
MRPMAQTISAARSRAATIDLPRPVNGALALGLSLAEPLEALRDARRLRREHPRLVPGDASFPALRSHYERYVREVSTAEMAVSWETAAYLRHLCEALRPARVLDLGSGFSSLVLRDYAAAAVVSGDDDAQWLERTRAFLEEEGHAEGELRLWRDFESAPGEPFDLIFHDLAGGRLRETAAPLAVRCLSTRGVIVFDDAHHLGHRRAAQRAAREAGLAAYSLYHWTHDAIGRFALLAAP